MAAICSIWSPLLKFVRFPLKHYQYTPTNPTPPALGVDVYINYPNINDTSLIQRTVNAFVSQLSSKAVAQGIDLPYLYVPNANVGQDPLTEYGGNVTALLKDVGRKYDPKRFMQKLQNKGFLTGG